MRPFLRRAAMPVRHLLLASLLGFSGSAFGACGTDAPATIPASSDLPARTPTYVADIVRTWPHDPDAFTQGLVWHENRLFESTGQVGKSSIREVELQTGRVIRRRDLAPPHFGEGIVILGDNLYQVTWTTGRAFVYDWRTFAPKREFRYDGEGWGLTTDGTSIIMSDGTSVIRYRDPATFRETRTINVTDNGTAVANINELEWVKGEIWANVWESDQIVRIDPTNGNVVGWIDLAGILPRMERRGGEDVLNGIAYDAAEDRIFVTGKNWPKLFEIRLRQRS
jgi:glutaminyl-peptide cyclotransferase